MTLINLATVTHQLHDDEKALFWLDKILLEKAPIYPSDSNMTAAFREAVILTNLTRFNEADSALQVSEKLCLQTCSLRFGIQVLRARLLLLKGNSEGALALAQETGKENEGGKEEHANALRVIAAAEENMGRHADALQHYQAALEMDKSLGMSSRIGEDLSGLSRTSSRLGHDQEAAAYARRAELVSGSQHQSAVPTGE
jgi:tetratricopeptide (TPR) repeat protein